MLRIPCVTLRENTERPETIEVGANVLVGRSLDKALAAIEAWRNHSEYHWQNPFGEGNVAEKIIDAIQQISVTNPEKRNQDNQDLSVTVIGLGYMGLPISCLIAESGINVTGVDLNHNKVASINQAINIFDEPGLDELLNKVIATKHFRASTQVSSSDIYLIAVPTPHKEGRCDLSYVLSAVDSILDVAQNGQLVIIESTIAPGTSKLVSNIFRDKGLNVEVVHCPNEQFRGKHFMS